MKLRSLVLVAFGLVISASATAESVQFPEGGPAFSINVPDDWSSAPDQDNNWTVVASNHQASIVLTVRFYAGTPDDIVTDAMVVAHAEAMQQGTPIKEHGTPIKLSNHDGFSYDNKITNSAGAVTNLYTIAAVLNDNHIAIITLITDVNIAPSDYSIARSIVDNAQLIQR